MQTIRERIIEHAANLFITKGCRAPTMDDIANSMGISKRTIYENFTDKQELIKQSLLYFFEENRNEITKILESNDNIFITIFKQIHSNSKNLLKMKYDFFNEVHKYYPNVYPETVHVFRREHLENTKKIFRKGQDDGVLRKNIDISIIAVLMMEIHLTIIRSQNIDNSARMDFVHTFMTCFVRGMATEKGVKLLDEYKFEEIT